MARVLIIDDDEMLARTLAKAVVAMGHEVNCSHTLREGASVARSEPFDVVLLDVNMPDGSGLDVLPTILETPSAPEVIIITGYGDHEGAELAIRSGAWDYLQKPLSLKEMRLPLIRALQYRREKRSRRPSVALKREGIIGSSPQITACLDLVAEAANSDASVLISGETGTGKELFAAAIHNNSTRAGKSFVVVDCAALPENLVESMLFGHQKGAFTGAHRDRRGLIEQANGGTLFLDEVGELPLGVQRAFLRVLQEHRFRPLGRGREVVSDFRVVAATNRNLEEMARSGQFRADLLFRLRSLVIDLKPLRERTEDIRDLAMWYMAELCKRYNTGTKGFSPEFLYAISAYDWPGNVRELLNALDGVFSAARFEPTLFPKHLPINIRVHLTQAAIERESEPEIAQPAPVPARVFAFKDFRRAGVDRLERSYLEELMQAAGGNVKEACKLARLSKTRLYGLLKKHGL